MDQWMINNDTIAVYAMDVLNSVFCHHRFPIVTHGTNILLLTAGHQL